MHALSKGYSEMNQRKRDRSHGKISESKPRGYKTFFMLSSVEHEILDDCKYKKYQEIRLF